MYAGYEMHMHVIDGVCYCPTVRSGSRLTFQAAWRYRLTAVLSQMLLMKVELQSEQYLLPLSTRISGLSVQ